MGLLKLKFVLALVLVAFVEWSPVLASDNLEILGCGGFVRSSYKLDLDKIEIKLFTKQGSLKVKTDCAPTTGYYFMPLEAKGDYVLKISPPEGWTFDPPVYEIHFDGSSDDCSKGVDKNFDFKGFSVFGKVVTNGFTEGPAAVQLHLTGPENLKMSTTTKAGGSFSFDSMPPGKYLIKAKHPSLTFGKDSFEFEITNRNVVIENQITVQGYEVMGIVRSDKTLVAGVTFVLLGPSQANKPTNCDTNILKDFQAPAVSPNNFLCHKQSDKAGVFKFSGLSPGNYAIVPVYKGKNIVYNVSPDRLDFELKHSSLELVKGFEVEGFTVSGRVSGISGASILVNGESKATSGADGSFEIGKMKAGTYNFDITSEGIQFDTVKVTITPTNPIIPDFHPSRFLICGEIKLSASSAPTSLQLKFRRQDKTGKIVLTRSEKVETPSRTCLFLDKGKYSVQVESKLQKYFIPEEQSIEIPSKSNIGFIFLEFNGHITGSVKCQQSPCSGSIQLKSADGKAVGVQELTASGPFKFPNLDSGDYVLSVSQGILCWKSSEIKVSLKNKNVENIVFEQVGFSLQLTTTHATGIRIFNAKKKLIDEFILEASKSVCVKEDVEVEPYGCHLFEQSVYPFKVGNQNEIQLVAKSHTYSGVIIANAEVPDLQIKLKRNDEEASGNTVKTTVQGKKNEVIYDVNVIGSEGEMLELNFFSYGFIFEPNVVSIQCSDDCEKDLFISHAKKSHLIQGKLIPPLADASIKIELVGEPEATTFVTTNAAGEYIAGPFLHTSFLVTPQKSGYTFQPLKDDPYSFMVQEHAKIRVRIADESTGAMLPNVLLSLSGPNAYRQNRLTDQNGELTFAELQPGEYYLKALLREFSFKPSAFHIELKEQENKVMDLKAKRESFSLYGQLSSLTGDAMPNLLVSAHGQGNCSEYGEEGTSDELGQFRIWSLKSYCAYEISVVKKDDFAHRVERTIPESLNVVIKDQDLHNASLIIIKPVQRMDITLRVLTKSPKNLESLKALIYSSAEPDVPFHIVPFNSISYIILPPIPKDSKEYFITFESNLNSEHYEFKLPEQINFQANKAYAHFTVDFEVEMIHLEQVVGKSSYFAFAFIIFVFLVITYFDRIGRFLKESMEKWAREGSASLGSKKSKLKAKAQ